MPDIIDLSSLGGGDEPLIDMTGMPKPKGVSVILNSRVEVKCDVRYSGINPVDGDRLYTVIAEIDWENYHPIALIVEETASDIEFRFRIPGMPDAQAQEWARAMRFMPGRIIEV